MIGIAEGEDEGRQAYIFVKDEGNILSAGSGVMFKFNVLDTGADGIETDADGVIFEGHELLLIEDMVFGVIFLCFRDFGTDIISLGQDQFRRFDYYIGWYFIGYIGDIFLRALFHHQPEGDTDAKRSEEKVFFIHKGIVTNTDRFDIASYLSFSVGGSLDNVI